MDILIADRDVVLLDTMKRYFSRIGHCVETAACGIDCLEILESWHPDVLVLDDELLWGGSHGVLQEMRKAADLHQIPVVMISDLDKWENGEEFPPLAGCISKPFRLQSLHDQICSLQTATRAHN